MTITPSYFINEALAVATARRLLANPFGVAVVLRGKPRQSEAATGSSIQLPLQVLAIL